MYQRYEEEDVDDLYMHFSTYENGKVSQSEMYDFLRGMTRAKPPGENHIRAFGDGCCPGGCFKSRESKKEILIDDSEKSTKKRCSSCSGCAIKCKDLFKRKPKSETIMAVEITDKKKKSNKNQGAELVP
jgi:hypothetical protein